MTDRVWNGWRVLVLVCLAATRSGPATGSQLALDERYRPAMTPSAAESLALAEELQEELHTGDLDGVNRLLDTGALVERVVAGLDGPSPSLETFVDGLIVTLQSRAWFGAEVMHALEAGGDYRLLRTFERNGERTVLFRMLTPDGGLNYHELFLERRGHGGPVRVADVLVYLTDDRLSESYRRSFIIEAYRAHDVRRFNELVHDQRHEEALALYAELPETLRNARSVLLGRLMITQQVSEELYLATIERIRSLYPEDPALDLISLDGFVLGKEYSRALDVLDRIDERVGGDPYLDVQRAGVFLLQNDYREAARFAVRAVSEDPHLEPGYWTLASIALETRNWALLVRALDGLEDNLALELGNLEDVPEYSEFVESREYEAWDGSERH